MTTTQTIAQLRKTGLTVLGDMPWGTHCCHFFQTRGDLLETLVPFFKVGLESKEFCLWVVHAPLTEEQARRAIRQRIAESDRYLDEGRLEIVSSREWYLKGGSFSMRRVLRAWDDKLAEAVARGYAGMRANGNMAWLEKKDWTRFDEYERALNESLARKAMIVLCSYALQKSGAAEVLDVARTHQFAIAKRRGSWQVVEWRTPPSSEDPYQTLTTREREILLLAAEGLTNPQIARRLSISVRTVESHRANLMRKLGLRNQTELVRYALRRGLLALEHRSRP